MLMICERDARFAHKRDALTQLCSVTRRPSPYFASTPPHHSFFHPPTMSRSLSRACSLSSASSFSSISDTNVDPSGASDMQPLGSQSSESKRTRKRFSHDQLIVLEQAYHSSSHPTREEREDIARRAEMCVPLAPPLSILNDTNENTSGA